MARDPKLYNLPAYLEASDVALAKNNSNLKTLTGYLADSDSGIRYWGACGMIMQNNLDSAAINALQGCLKDESLDVRAMAAWALIKAGDKKNGQECLIQLLNQESYATLKVLNIIDWMGVDTAPYLPAIKSLKTGPGDYLMTNNKEMNPQGVVFKDMQDYLVNPDERPPIYRRSVIQKDEEFIRKAEKNLKDANGKPYEEQIP